MRGAAVECDAWGGSKAQGRAILRPVAVTRALDNLVGNALRYGSRAVVNLFVTPRSLRITVEDDGPGIPADRRDEAMKPFSAARCRAQPEPRRRRRSGSCDRERHRAAPRRRPAAGGQCRAGRLARGDHSAAMRTGCAVIDPTKGCYSRAALWARRKDTGARAGSRRPAIAVTNGNDGRPGGTRTPNQSVMSALL